MTLLLSGWRGLFVQPATPARAVPSSISRHPTTRIRLHVLIDALTKKGPSPASECYATSARSTITKAVGILDSPERPPCASPRGSIMDTRLQDWSHRLQFLEQGEVLDSDGRDTLTRLIDEMRRALDDDELPDEVVMFLRDQVIGGVEDARQALLAWRNTLQITTGSTEPQADDQDGRADPDGADAGPAASSSPTPAAPASPSVRPDRGSQP